MNEAFSSPLKRTQTQKPNLIEEEKKWYCPRNMLHFVDVTLLQCTTNKQNMKFNERKNDRRKICKQHKCQEITKNIQKSLIEIHTA